MKTWLAILCAAILAGAAVAGTSAATPDVDAQVDRIFARWNTATTPGCTVGAAVGGQPVLAKAYGMADLVYDVKNTPAAIFEAGSVSKQFTAASMLLLARDGKLSIDDPVKKYIPELSLPVPPGGFGAA